MKIKILDDALYDITKVVKSLRITKHRINQDLKNKYYSIIYLLQIFELSSDIRTLMNNDSINSAPLILRSIMDCLYTILNMEKDPFFIDKIAKKSVAEEEKRVRMLDNNLEHQNYWKILNDKFDDKDNITDLQKYQNIHGDQKLYRLAFSKLSKTVHNDLITLENKFFQEVDGIWQLNYDIGINDDNDANMIIHSVAISIYCAIESVLNIHDLNSELYSEKAKAIINLHFD